MNGIHDMGGMQGLGEIGYKESEPMFHEAWEGRIFTLIRAMQGIAANPMMVRDISSTGSPHSNNW